MTTGERGDGCREDLPRLGRRVRLFRLDCTAAVMRRVRALQYEVAEPLPWHSNQRWTALHDHSCSPQVQVPWGGTGRLQRSSSHGFETQLCVL